MRMWGLRIVLPECSFGASGGHKNLWRHARSYGGEANIEGATKAVREFERTYLRKQEHYQWIDDRDLIFGRNAARHADAPFPRGWKFSCRLPDGFHYDLTNLEKRTFSLTDIGGSVTPRQQTDISIWTRTVTSGADGGGMSLHRGRLHEHRRAK
jgi:hypothetical protein